MYISLWQVLPGSSWQKSVMLMIAGLCVFLLLMLGIFPLIESWFIDPTAPTTVGEVPQTQVST